MRCSLHRPISQVSSDGSPWPLRFLILLAACAGARAPAASASVYVSGVVTISGTDAPVERASVSLTSATSFEPHETAHTLLNGSFIVKLAQPGDYSLTVESDTCVPKRTRLTVPAEGLAGLKVVLEALPALHLKLIGPDGNPLHGGHVDTWMDVRTGDNNYRPPIAFPPMRPGVAHTQDIGRDGSVVLPGPRGVPTEQISEVTVGVRDAQIGCGQTHVEGWSNEPVLIYLQKGAVLDGEVVDDATKPLKGVSITAIRVPANTSPNPFQLLVNPRMLMMGGGTLQAAATTGEDGKFSIPALPYGSYMVRAMIPQAGQRTRMVTLSKPNQEVALSTRDNPWPANPPFGNPQFGAPQFGNPQFGNPRGGGPYRFRQPIPMTPPFMGAPQGRGFGQAPGQGFGQNRQLPPIPRIFPGPRRMNPMPQQTPLPSPRPTDDGIDHLIANGSG